MFEMTPDQLELILFYGLMGLSGIISAGLFMYAMIRNL